MDQLRQHAVAHSLYFIRVNGAVEGPYTLALLRAKILDGSMPESAEVRLAEEEYWRPVKDLFDRMFPSWR
jgi:hypothetical protein